MTAPLGVTFALLAVLAAGCGDPVEGYFDQAGEIVDTMRADSIAATPRAGAITRDGVVGVNEARRTAAESLVELSPPDEVLPEHLALVTALEDLVGAVDRFLATTSGLDDEALASEVEAASDLQSLAVRVGSACDTLDRRAAELEIDVTIRC